MADTWHRFLIDSYGFVLHDEEDLLAHVDDPDYIWDAYGECIPDRIVVVRDSAMPKPQSPGSKTLRAPGTYATEDQIEFDVSEMEQPTPAFAALLWKAAEGIVKHLNTETQEVTT